MTIEEAILFYNQNATGYELAVRGADGLIYFWDEDDIPDGCLYQDEFMAMIEKMELVN
jgi:hypothetical protein